MLIIFVTFYRTEIEQSRTQKVQKDLDSSRKPYIDVISNTNENVYANDMETKAEVISEDPSYDHGSLHSIKGDMA